MNNWRKQFAMIYAGQTFSILGSAAVQFAVVMGKVFSLLMTAMTFSMPIGLLMHSFVSY